MEGPEESGKSVLSQHIASAALDQGLKVAYYTSLASADDLSTQMSSLGLNALKSDGTDGNKIISMAQLYQKRIKAAKVFTVLSEHMARLFQEGANVVIFDDLTPTISDDHDPIINFFQRASQLSEMGLTVLTSIRSSKKDPRLINQLLETVDTHLSLTVEVQPKGRRMEVFSQLEVKKIDSTTPVYDNKVMFRVSRRLMRFENRSLEVIPATELVQ